MSRKLLLIKSFLVFAIVIITMIPKSTYASVALPQFNAGIPSDWAKEEIHKAMEMGLIPKRIQGDYGNKISREEFGELALTLYESLVGQEVSLQGENPFLDTKNPKIAAANKLGLVKGLGEGIFAPNENITREQMSVMIYRTLQVAKPNYDYSNLHEYRFSDFHGIASWSREAVGYLYSIEVINGTSDNRFDPKGFSTREESIVLAYRMNNKTINVRRESRNTISPSRGSIRREEDPMELKLKGLISKEMGKPYIWGGTGPNGYDCSGLTYSIYGKLGISIPRTSKDQINAGSYVAKKDLQYGDLVLFARDGKNINHVGIYIGNGQFVHSPQSGDVVKATTLMSGYYANSYYAARRLLRK